jgi:hypothetical protein
VAEYLSIKHETLNCIKKEKKGKDENKSVLPGVCQEYTDNERS